MNNAVEYMFILIAALVMNSCRNSVVYDNSERVALPEWNCDSAVTFSFEVDDTDVEYQTEILVRNSGRYEYQNLWLFVTRTAPDSSEIRDTVQYFLADEYGRWNGSGIGSLYTNLFMYEDSISHIQKGLYRYKIEHGMRVDNLKGINDIGIKVTKRE